MSRSLAVAFAAILLAPTLSARAEPPSERAPASKPGEDFRDKVDALRQRIRTALDAGEVDNDEAARALRELRDIRGDTDAARGRNGDRLPDADRALLQARLDRLTAEIHWRKAPSRGTAAAARLWSLQRREHWLDQRVTRSLAEGGVDTAEAARVRDELTDVRYQEQRLRAAHDGRLAERDLQRLEEWLDRLIESIHWTKPPAEHRPW